jgi:hypothetical protein
MELIKHKDNFTSFTLPTVLRACKEIPWMVGFTSLEAPPCLSTVVFLFVIHVTMLSVTQAMAAFSNDWMMVNNGFERM